MILSERVSEVDLAPAIRRMWELSAEKIRLIHQTWNPADGAPVITRNGRYTSRGWTEWTHGFQFGSALLQFEAAGQSEFLDLGRAGTTMRMPLHVTHFGVHDHGFNIVSTYGNLLRLMRCDRIPRDPSEEGLYILALKSSGAVQARRWTRTDDGGFIYSFNGPHSLFADTLRSLRSLALAHLLGHALTEEQDRRVSLLERLIQHAATTARFSVYYGEGRDIYDVRGRVAHESIFNPVNGSYRSPGSQQGYSPFTTWTRGLAWVMLGFAEQLQLIRALPDTELAPFGGRMAVEPLFRRAAEAVCDYYLENTPSDGVPYWDTGAPGLPRMGDYLARPAEPFNDHEPVDSSAAAIAAQALVRMGDERYRAAGLAIARTLLQAPYLSEDPAHQGLLLHSVYHRPNGWDYVPPGRSVPCGESSMWGDYHLRELACTIERPDYTFFQGILDE